MRAHPAAASAAPEWVSGAFVVCYAAAADHHEAVRKAVAKLAGKGMTFDDMAGDIEELDPARWDDYVTAQWIDFAEAFPEQDDLPALIAQGAVFFGPFCAYEAP